MFLARSYCDHFDNVLSTAPPTRTREETVANPRTEEHMTSFANRVILITGAASGIGRQLAVDLAAEGALIAAVDLQADALAKLAAELPQRVATAVADVTDLAGLRNTVARLEAQLGPTDILIACAGIGRETLAETFNAEEFRVTIDINLIGTANSIDAVLAGMRQRRRGHLVALSSLASYRGLPRMAAYCASKAGVNALMDALRVELRPCGIHCTTICPGWIKTPMTATLKLPGLRMMEVREAAQIIVAALRWQRPFLAFPPNNAWQVRLLRYLPQPVSDWMCTQLFKRSRKQ
jgi:NAD(P)-dependent dehydrogenase (short-subunit alcohol dehydrogenase family)